MTWNPEQLETELVKLEGRIPVLLADHPDEDPVELITAAAATIFENAPDHQARVHERIRCVLGSLGAIPGGNSGTGCR